MRVDIFGVLEIWRVNIDVIEAWYHITIEKAETVGSVGFELRIVAVDSVVLGLIWEFGGQGKVRHFYASDKILIFFEVDSHQQISHKLGLIELDLYYLF